MFGACGGRLLTASRVSGYVSEYTIRPSAPGRATAPAVFAMWRIARPETAVPLFPISAAISAADALPRDAITFRTTSGVTVAGVARTLALELLRTAALRGDGLARG